MFFDPWGLKIRVSGTDEQKGLLLEDIRKITDDEVDYKGSYIVILKQNDDGNRPVGTRLIRELINKFPQSVNISFRDGKPQSGGNSISLNKDFDLEPTYTMNSKGETEITLTPTYIILAHELIHVWRYFSGYQSISWIGFNSFKLPDGKVRSEKWFSEEFETVGIAHLSVKYSYNSNTMLDAKFIPASGNGLVITENDIRREHLNDVGGDAVQIRIGYKPPPGV